MKKDTKLDIVKASIELFKQKSVAEVKVSEICDKAKVTRNAFYYYFKEKQSLFDAIGDYISETSKKNIVMLREKNSSYRQIWEIYRPFLEKQIELGADIMNSCCFSRTSKGQSDNYMYVDESIATAIGACIDIARANGEIKTTAETDDLIWCSYAMVRGYNIKWCFRYGESDLIADAKLGLNTLFQPAKGYELK